MARADLERRTTVGTLDALRLVAALMVVLYHFLFMSWTEPAGNAGIRDVIGAAPPLPAFLPWASVGWVGVEVFFVISGFVITMSAYGKTPGRFARDRFARIFPGLVTFATLAWAAVVVAGVLPLGEATLRWLRSIVLFPQGPWIDGALWTLVAELVFYAMIWLILRFGLIRRIPMLVRVAVAINLLFWTTVIAGTAMGQGWLHLAGAYPLRVTLVSTGCYFLFGMVAQEIFSRGLTTERLMTALVALFCCLASLVALTARSSGVVHFGQIMTTPIALWFICMAIGGIGLWRERRCPPSPRVQTMLRTMGLLTYPLYLFHQISGGWILGRVFAMGVVSPTIAVILVTGVCLGVSYLFAMLIERPLRQWIMAVVDRALAPFQPKFSEEGAAQKTVT